MCDADGATSEAEGRFLGQLQAALSLPPEQTVAAQSAAEQLATMPVEKPLEPAAAVDPANAGTAPPATDDAARVRQAGAG